MLIIDYKVAKKRRDGFRKITKNNPNPKWLFSYFSQFIWATAVEDTMVGACPNSGISYSSLYKVETFSNSRRNAVPNRHDLTCANTLPTARVLRVDNGLRLNGKHERIGSYPAACIPLKHCGATTFSIKICRYDNVCALTIMMFFKHISTICSLVSLFISKILFNFHKIINTSLLNVMQSAY